MSLYNILNMAAKCQKQNSTAHNSESTAPICSSFEIRGFWHLVFRVVLLTTLQFSTILTARNAMEVGPVDSWQKTPRTKLNFQRPMSNGLRDMAFQSFPRWRPNCQNRGANRCIFGPMSPNGPKIDSWDRLYLLYNF